jgi:hypothetical protein
MDAGKDRVEERGGACGKGKRSGPETEGIEEPSQPAATTIKGFWPLSGTARFRALSGPSLPNLTANFDPVGELRSRS